MGSGGGGGEFVRVSVRWVVGRGGEVVIVRVGVISVVGRGEVV